jgi:hypothetical protein
MEWISCHRVYLSTLCLRSIRVRHYSIPRNKTTGSFKFVKKNLEEKKSTHPTKIGDSGGTGGERSGQILKANVATP